MNAEQKFLAALARARRLRAQAEMADAEAVRLNPWLPEHVRRADAEMSETRAALYLDMAAESEGEMA